MKKLILEEKEEMIIIMVNIINETIENFYNGKIGEGISIKKYFL